MVLNASARLLVPIIPEYSGNDRAPQRGVTSSFAALIMAVVLCGLFTRRPALKRLCRSWGGCARREGFYCLVPPQT